MNRLLDKIAKFDYYDSLYTTKKQQELSIGEYVDEIVEDAPTAVGFIIPDGVFKNDDLTVDNFLDICAEAFNKNKTKIVNEIVDSFVDIYEEELDDNEITAIRRNMKNYLNKNFNAIAKHAVDLQYPSEEAIISLIKSKTDNSDFIKKVQQAYKNVQEWLKNDAPELKLAILKDEDIQLVDLGNDGEAYQYKQDGQWYAHIAINKSIIARGEAVLMNTIYHEICHCIKGQADEADEKYKNRIDKDTGEIIYTDDDFQNDAHNDEIWNKASAIVSKHSGYYIQQYENEYEHRTQKLNQPHEASIICYDCGWFDVYEEFDKNCEQANTGSFRCPECGSSNIKLIYSNEDERGIINDALDHLNNEMVKQHAACSNIIVKRLIFNQLQKRKYIRGSHIYGRKCQHTKKLFE